MQLASYNCRTEAESCRSLTVLRVLITLVPTLASLSSLHLLVLVLLCVAGPLVLMIRHGHLKQCTARKSCQLRHRTLDVFMHAISSSIYKPIPSDIHKERKERTKNTRLLELCLRAGVLRTLVDHDITRLILRSILYCCALVILQMLIGRSHAAQVVLLWMGLCPIHCFLTPPQQGTKPVRLGTSRVVTQMGRDPGLFRFRKAQQPIFLLEDEEEDEVAVGIDEEVSRSSTMFS